MYYLFAKYKLKMLSKVQENLISRESIRVKILKYYSPMTSRHAMTSRGVKGLWEIYEVT